jgi:hypothetical protein
MKFTFLLLKLTITASLCVWLYTRVDLQALQEGLAHLGALPIVLAVLLHVAVVFLGAFRWWILLTHTHATTPFYKAFPSYYLGLFFNNLLPTGLGGDAVRILHLRARGVNTKALVSSTLMDRIIGLSTVIIMGFCGVLISKNFDFSSYTKTLFIALILFGLLIAGILLSDRSFRFIEAIAQKYRHTRVRTWLLDILLACYSYRATKLRIAFAYAISVIGQSLVIIVYFMLGRGLGIDLTLATYFVAIPVVFLAASLPVSIGGLGVREGALVGMLISAGADLKIAVNLSLAYLIVLLISSMPGALVILFSRIHKNGLIETDKNKGV